MWGEVESEKTLEKWKARALARARTQSGRQVAEEDLSEAGGNPLIGSLGRTGREFFNLLVDRDAHDVPLKFREPRGNALLARLQRWTFEVFPSNRRNENPSLKMTSPSLSTVVTERCGKRRFCGIIFCVVLPKTRLCVRVTPW